MIQVIVFLLFTVLCNAGKSYHPDDLPVVILRIDDIVTFFCEDEGLLAINTVIDTKTPISVGIIANGLRANKKLSSKLAKIAESEYVEIMHHSFYHDDYTGNDYTWQQEDLMKGEVEIASVTGRRPTTFAPPRNTYDNTTVQVMLENPDINLMSSQCSWRRDVLGTPIFCRPGCAVVVPNISYNGLYMLPTGAVMGGQAYFQDFLQPASLEDTVGWIESQIANQGFSVLMLHPLEFSKDETCTQIDQSKIDVLLEVIAYGQDKWQFMTFQQALEYYTGVKPSNDIFYNNKGNDTGAGTSKAEWVFAFALLVVGGVTIISCCCSFTHPERAKLIACCRTEPTLAASYPAASTTAASANLSAHKNQGNGSMHTTAYSALSVERSPMVTKV